MKKIIITFVALIIGLICRAQTIDEHYYFKSLSSQNGLSQNTVMLSCRIRKALCGLARKMDWTDMMAYRSGILNMIEPIREVWQ